MAERVLVLDFDGVVCDSLGECLRIAWYSYIGAPLQAFADDLPDGVPSDVADRFRRLRPYMRHLGHFLVPMLDGPPPADAATFSARFASLEPGRVREFAGAAATYRAAVRRHHRQAWLDRHLLHPRVGGLVEGAYIATARDRAAVTTILRASGARPVASRVFGSLSDKTAALRSIAAIESAPRAAVQLVDDSIANCIEARDAGFAASLATWGYNGPDDATLARFHGIPVLTIDNLCYLGIDS